MDVTQLVMGRSFSVLIIARNSQRGALHIPSLVVKLRLCCPRRAQVIDMHMSQFASFSCVSTLNPAYWTICCNTYRYNRSSTRDN